MRSGEEICPHDTAVGEISILLVFTFVPYCIFYMCGVPSEILFSTLSSRYS